MRAALVLVTALIAAGCASTTAPRGAVSFFVHGPGDILAVTHGSQVGIGVHPPGIADLAETNVDDTLLLLALLRDETGAVVGIASELEHFPALPVRPGTRWDTYWTLVVPGRGTLYAYHQEALSAELVDAFDSAAASGKGWRGVIRKRNTVGPRGDGLGRLVGGTGEFAGLTGTFAELGELRGISADGALDATLELRFEFDGSP